MRITQGLVLLLCIFLVVACKKEEDEVKDPVRPVVSAVDPADGATSVTVSKSPSLTFSLDMASASLSTNEGGTSCSGTIQLSSNSFSTCVALSSSLSSSDKKTWSFSPSSSLAYSTTYQIKVTTGATTTLNAPLKEDFTSSFTTEATTDTSTDSTAPTPGGSGAITASSISFTSLSLAWTAASDNSTDAASLTYKVYYSTSSNIDTVANIKANGTAATTSSLTTTGATVTGLSTGTTYHFNVLVSDATGNEAVYTTTSATTSSRSTLTNTAAYATGGTGYMFSSSQDFGVSTTATFAVWFKLNATPGLSSYLFHLGANISNEIFSAYLANTDKVYFKVNDGAGNFKLIYSTNSAIATNTLYHLVLVVSGTSLNMYLNGEAVSVTTAEPTAITSLTSLSRSLVIGADSSYANKVNATINSLAIWNDALSVAAINELYYSGSPTMDLKSNYINYGSSASLKHWYLLGSDNSTPGKDYTSAWAIDLTMAGGSVVTF